MSEKSDLAGGSLFKSCNSIDKLRLSVSVDTCDAKDLTRMYFE